MIVLFLSHLTCEYQSYSADMLLQMSWDVPCYARRHWKCHKQKPDIMNSDGARNIRLNAHRHATEHTVFISDNIKEFLCDNVTGSVNYLWRDPCRW